MCPDTMDKSVAIEPDFQGEGEWKMVQLECLLAALVDSKVVAMKADQLPNYMKKPLHLKDHKKHKYCRHGERHYGAKSALCKVRQWDDGSAMLVCDKSSRVSSEEKYVTVDMEELREERKKRRKKRRHLQPLPPQPVAPKVLDPEDLPKRAKWTIIITAGFLLLTCMLLVGVTLRMAPIIDDMVHKQNKEFMEILNRSDYSGSFTS